MYPDRESVEADYASVRVRLLRILHLGFFSL
jgi:hypothetical protein